ncbi:MAG: antibiotic biosynthesis monooxygenase [Planctomycetes bacterium]|nr:antibiotic biosynthesis monooxygenase [Planctomycetota bacterium]
MIHVLAQVETVAGQRENFLAEFSKVRPLVHKEAGCIEYTATIDVATDIGAQKLLGEQAVMIVEKWESLDHLKAHLVAPHMADYRIRVKPFVLSVTLRVLSPA